MKMNYSDYKKEEENMTCPKCGGMCKEDQDGIKTCTVCGYVWPEENIENNLKSEIENLEKKVRATKNKDAIDAIERVKVILDL